MGPPVFVERLLGFEPKIANAQAGIPNQAIRRPHRVGLGPCGDVAVRVLFSFPEEDTTNLFVV